MCEAFGLGRHQFSLLGEKVTGCLPLLHLYVSWRFYFLQVVVVGKKYGWCQDEVSWCEDLLVSRDSLGSHPYSGDCTNYSHPTMFSYLCHHLPVVGDCTDACAVTSPPDSQTSDAAARSFAPTELLRRGRRERRLQSGVLSPAQSCGCASPPAGL